MKSLKLIAISLLGLNFIGNSCWGMEPNPNKPGINVSQQPVGNPHVNLIPNINEAKGPLYSGSEDMKTIKKQIAVQADKIRKSDPQFEPWIETMSKDITNQIVNAIRRRINENEKLKVRNTNDSLTSDVLAASVWNLICKQSYETGAEYGSGDFLKGRTAEKDNIGKMLQNINNINVVQEVAPPICKLNIPEEIEAEK